MNVQGPVLKVVAVVGVLICLAWFEHMLAFGALFDAELRTVHKFEKELQRNLPLKLFTDEATFLQERKNPKTKWSYSPITLVD